MIPRVEIDSTRGKPCEVIILVERQAMARIEPHLPTNLTGPSAGRPAYYQRIVHMLQSGARGATARVNTVPTPRSTIAFNRGPSVNAGLRSSMLWRRQVGLRDAVVGQHIGQSASLCSGGKGGMHASDRPLTRRAHNEDPHAE